MTFTIRRPRVLARLTVCLAGIAAAAQTSASDLEQGFDSPPVSTRPLGWWHWINGNVTREGIDADLEAIKRSGMGGVQMFDVEMYMPKGPVRYGTDSWFDHILHAIRKADDLGLEFHFMNTPGWSASGGPWVTEELSMKRVVWSETGVDGGAVDITLARPDGTPVYDKGKTPATGGFYRDIAVLALPATNGPSDTISDLAPKIGWKAKPLTRSTDNRTGLSSDRVINLTGKMDAAGKLAARLPEGKWTILRFGFASTGKLNHPAVPEGLGLEIDKLDADAVAFQFERAVLPLIRKAGPLAGKAFNGLLFDSFEGGFQNWTQAFPEAFAKQKGYDFIPWLPLLTGRIIESEAVSEAVLWDFRQVIEELIAENYFGTMQRLAAPHGIRLYSESQGGPLNPMSANRHVDVPMNEFWVSDRITDGAAARIRQSVSSANFQGKRVVASEAFTATPKAGKYQNTPASLKRLGDQAFALGLNRFAFHSWTHQPVTAAAPGFALGRYGVHFGRLNTWWPYADAWIEYLARSQFLLQQGRPVADICLLVDEDLGYGLPAAAVRLAAGYDFAVGYPSDLGRMTARCDVVSHPDAGDFRLLLTPDTTIAKTWVATLPTLRALRRLVADGAVLAGEPPTAPAGLADLRNAAEFDRLVDELWDGLDGVKTITKKVGLGHVYRGRQPSQILIERGVAPDVRWSPEKAPVVFSHRTTPEAEIYFVSSQSKEPAKLELEFRQHDRVPELWDAVTGERSDATIFQKTSDGIRLSVAFEPYGAVFVVFRKGLPARWVVSVEPASLVATQTVAGLLAKEAPVSARYSDGRQASLDRASAPPGAQPIAGPWRVAFPDGRGAPSGELTFDQLIPWPDHSDAGVKYYSGTAIYRTHFTAAAPRPNQVALLDLGTVADIARVFVNGHDAGVAWHPPFRLDISRWLREGGNTLEVHVANRWINRLIGDEAITDEVSYRDTGGKSVFTEGGLLKLPDWLYQPEQQGMRKRHSFSIWKHYNADSPLVPAGLIGPVRLEWLSRFQGTDLSGGK